MKLQAGTQRRTEVGEEETMANANDVAWRVQRGPAMTL